MERRLAMNLPFPIQFEEGWTVIEEGIKSLHKILAESPEPHCNLKEHIKLHSIIYNMCTQYPPHNYCEQLYEKYQEAVKDLLNTIVLPLLTERRDELFLKELLQSWENHKVMVKWLSHLFEYLERYFIPDMSFPGLNEVGMKCFRDTVLPNVYDKVRDVVSSITNQEREGEQVDKALLRDILHLFLETEEGRTTHLDSFKEHMLDAASDYYSRKAPEWFSMYSCRNYLLKAEECRDKEWARAGHFFDKYDSFIQDPTKQKLFDYKTKLTEIVKNQLLEKFASNLIHNEHSGCLALLRDNMVDDLSLMYDHLWPVGGLKHIVAVFKQHITCEGTALVQPAAEAVRNQATFLQAPKVVDLQKRVLVRNIIELHDRSMACMNDCFRGDETNEFYMALKEVFEVLCSKSVAGCSITERLATFIDDILRNQSLTCDSIQESEFSKVVPLLAYVSEKDLFAEFYRTKLGGRLLSKRDVSDGLEERALKILSLQCDHNYKGMLEMVKDMALSKTIIQEDFKTYLDKKCIAPPGFDFRVSVLDKRRWPSYKSFELHLPAEMEKCVKVFKEFYEVNMTRGRKLSWIYSLGNCNIDGKFEQKTIELIVSIDQAAALLLFNSSDRLSYSEIMIKLNTDHDHTVRLLQSLSCAKYKILTKEPNNDSVTPADYFEFNSKFTDINRKIRVIDSLQVPFQLEVDERKGAVGYVDMERSCVIDASLVRIMKSRKVFGHQQLVGECLEQLGRGSFKPDVKTIKKRIEKLIDREFFERDEKNRNTYKFLA